MITPIITCPLGAKCEELKDNKLYRCAWFVELKGKNPQTNEDVGEWRCAVAWMPVMAVEVAQTNRGTSASVQSMRNEVVARQDLFNGLISSAVRLKKNSPTVVEVKEIATDPSDE